MTSNKRANKEIKVIQTGMLLDFLIANMNRLSRNSVKSLLTRKFVLVDGTVQTKHDYCLRPGQIVTIKSEISIDTMGLEIIYEDDDIICINKPAGLLSIATDKEKNETAYNLLTQYVKSKDKNTRVYIIHRLDRDTSGVFVIAKNEGFRNELQDKWDELIKCRGYVAIVEGNPPKAQDRIESYLKETSTHLMYSGKGTDGLKAITNYKVVQSNENYSLLEIIIETGRKNQIRVHMKDIGHPIVGDKKYGSSCNPLRRLALHSNKLEFVNPISGQLMCFEAKLPKGFRLSK